MAIEHSVLTGASLHEPKGVATAPSGTVYVSNGLGSGVWTDFDQFNAFGGSLLHVRDQRAANSPAQSLVGGGTWNKRDLQTTVVNGIVGATLTSSVISLPAGTYIAYAVSDVESFSTNNVTERYQLRLRNTTGGTDLVAGHPVRFLLTSSSLGVGTTTLIHTSHLPLYGRFVLGGTSNIELQLYILNAATNGGNPAGVAVEVFSDVMIWKID